MSATDPVQTRSRFTLRAYFVIVFSLWSLFVIGSFTWNILHLKRHPVDEAYAQAKMALKKDLFYRRWNSLQGGVYIPVSTKTPPNPYLEQIPERDITTPSGKPLTLMNPAYMTRLVYELDFEENGNLGHLTSLNPLRPQNAPDAWEEDGLKSFEKGGAEFFSVETIDGKKYFRYMIPFNTEASCLRCHAAQGYKEGEIRGGIAIAIAMQPLLHEGGKMVRRHVLTHLLLWATGAAIMLIGYRALRHSDQERNRTALEREQLITELQKSLREIKTLSGLLPICASCKKIRDDKGYWNKLEVYLRDHAAVEFSHGICPDCARKLYPEEFED